MTLIVDQMPPKKIKTDQVEQAAAKWTEGGAEQKELNRLFENKTIDESDLPNKVRLSNSMFMRFTPKVFAAHFRKTKVKYGLAANNKYEDELPWLSELGSPNESNNLNKAGNSKTDPDIEEVNDSENQYENAPSITWTYTDHVKKIDMVCAAVPIISGSQNINFGLSEDGTKLIISYVWPEPMYSPAVLFAKKIVQNEMSMTHPKIHAFANRLLECEFSDVSKPRGRMVISLPMKVQRETGTWTKEGLIVGDTNVVLLEFKAYQKKLVIEDADTSITFA